MTTAQPSVGAGRRLRLYLVVNFLSSLGSAAALLGATVVSSDAGSSGGMAATYTALMLALNYGSAALVTPYASRLALRFGSRQVYAALQALTVAAYLLLGVGIIAGLPGFPLLMLITPLLGAFGGLAHAVSPPIVHAYCAGEDLASAESRTSVTSGLAWVIGALVGGTIIDALGAPTAFLLNGVLTVPLVLLVILLPPLGEIPKPRQLDRPWRSLLRSLRTNDRLRRAGLLGVATAVLVSPFVSMVVPVSRQIGHDMAVHAGIVLAAISFGAVLSPVAVQAAGTRWGPLRASAATYALAGAVFVGIAAVVFLSNGTIQLVGFAAFGVVFGATTSAGSNLLLEDASDSAERAEEQQETLAAYFLVVGLGVPIGSLMWAHLSSVLHVPVMLAILGAGMVVVATLVVVHLNRLGVHRPPAVERKHHVPGGPHGTRFRWFS